MNWKSASARIRALDRDGAALRTEGETQMVNKALAKRIKRAESAAGVNGDPLPTIFIGITDSSRSDPDHPEKQVEFGDASVIGYMIGHTLKLTRQPAETVGQLEERAKRLAPDARVFFTYYAGWDPHGHWDRAQEIT
jgi:hypothetical protein